MNNLAIKVYKPDYSFIIDNYLDPNLWGKEYTLYEYKDFKASIQLDSIKVVEKEICFTVITTDYVFGGFGYDSVVFKMNHPEYTVGILINKINQQVENRLKRHFGFKNYEAQYNEKKRIHNDEYDLYLSLYKEEVKELYDNLPDLVQNYFGGTDYLLKELVRNKIDAEPRKLDFSEEHYIQEMEIYKGIRQQIDNADFGAVEIKIDEQLTIAIKQNCGDELTDEEKETYENWVESQLDELRDGFEDNVADVM